jgi:preprotein translocase subunit SecD
MKTSFLITGIAILLSLGVLLGVTGADAPPRVEFRHAQDEATPGFTERQIEGSSQSVYVHDEADFVLTPEDIEEAKAGKDERMRPMVGITLTRQGGEKMGRLTGDWVGKRLAILVDGRLVSAPVVRTKITNAALILGDFTEAEARQIARSLQAN